jgi:hypothetical protein
MGAGELNYCVRNGNRCDLTAITTISLACKTYMLRVMRELDEFKRS